jgi:acylphosphatase
MREKSYVCLKIIVTGKVQGVFFRDSLRAEALRIGLTGYARNRADGRVEIIACGDEEAVYELVRFARRGTLISKVDKVVLSEVPTTEKYEDFDIKY